MAVQERLYTSEDLAALPVDIRYELVEGKLIQMSPTGKPHGLLTILLGSLIYPFVREHDLGRVYGAETGFKVAEDPDTVYGIDLAFVSSARVQSGGGYFIGAPDLLVEVYSPGNRKAEMHKKLRDCFKAGTRLAWVFYPESRVIYVYNSSDDIKVLKVGDTLTGGDVLPGFSVRVVDVFAVLDE